MNRNVVITGANRGIGLALAKYYKNTENNVYAACRKSSRELDDLGVNVISGIDVSREEDIKQLVTHLRDLPIDIVINNAGIYGKEHLGTINYDKLRELYEVNAIAPLRLTEALYDNMGTGTKIALITSRMGSIADNTSGSGYDYRMSKAALNAAGKSLAVDYQEDGISVAILHPGFVQTDMVGGNGDISADVAAERLAQRIAELNASNSGTFWHSNGEVLPW